MRSKTIDEELIAQRLSKFKGRHFRLFNRIASGRLEEKILNSDFTRSEVNEELKKYFDSDNKYIRGVASALYSKINHSIYDTRFPGANLGLVIKNDDVNTNFDIEKLGEFMESAGIYNSHIFVGPFGGLVRIAYYSNILRGAMIKNSSVASGAVIRDSSIANGSIVDSSSIANYAIMGNSSIANYAMLEHSAILKNSSINRSVIANYSTIKNSNIVDNSNIFNSKIAKKSRLTHSNVADGAKVRESSIGEGATKDEYSTILRRYPIRLE